MPRACGSCVSPPGAAPPPEPPYGGLGEDGWLRGITFYDFVDRAGEARAAIETAFRDCRVPGEMAVALASYTRHVRVLALVDFHDPASGCVVAQAERFFTHSTRVWMRMFDTDANADLVARYAPEGEGLPVLVFFGEDRREFARWARAGDGTTLLPSLHRLLEAHAAPTS